MVSFQRFPSPPVLVQVVALLLQSHRMLVPVLWMTTFAFCLHFPLALQIPMRALPPLV